jgi:hypothetical protein
VAADFKTPEPVARNLIPGVNSRILVFERTAEARAPAGRGAAAAAALPAAHAATR